MKHLIIKISLILLVAGQCLALEVESYLKENLSDFKYFTYEVTSLPNRVESIDDPRLVIDSERELRVRKGYAYLPVKIDYGQMKYIKSTITLKINLYQDVLVAVRNIARGEEIYSADFILIEKEVSSFRNKPLRNYAMLDGAVAKTLIKEKSILHFGMLKRQPVIKQGDRVNAQFVVGSVQVSFFVTARGDGSVDDKIKVVRDDKKIFKAKVIDLNNVIIIE